ncbi:acetyl-CoA hydrolase/transferase family protein [Caproiciproducens sp.]
MDICRLYESRKCSIEESLQRIHSGDEVMLGCAAGMPVNIAKQLHTIAGRVQNVHVWSSLEIDSYPFMTDPSMAGKIETKSFFFGLAARAGHDAGICSLVPVHLHDMLYCKEGVSLKGDVFICSVSPMDERGNLYMSLSLQWEKEALSTAKTVILEVNRNMPVVYGETAIPVERADCIVEVDTPVPSLPNKKPTEVEKAIAQYVSSLVRDGDCIQLGIGGTPNAVAGALMEKRHLGVHSEMITSSMVDLIEAGAVDCTRKTLHPQKCIGSFVYGNRHLYDFIDRNDFIELHPTRYVNNPEIVAKNENMVSINSALEVDLTGQVCSESIGTRQYSASGGATDFAYGAFHSKGGRGIIAFSSTVHGGERSRIRPCLTPGSVVSISRNIVDYIVTEYGIAPMRGRTVRQRVDNLISVAHPDFRSQLKEDSWRLGIW